MTGADVEAARVLYEREIAALLLGPRTPTSSDQQIALHAAEFLHPRTYRRARRPIPDEAERYTLAVAYVHRAKAELARRPDRRSDPDREVTG